MYVFHSQLVQKMAFHADVPTKEEMYLGRDSFSDERKKYIIGSFAHCTHTHAASINVWYVVDRPLAFSSYSSNRVYELLQIISSYVLVICTHNLQSQYL